MSIYLVLTSDLLAQYNASIYEVWLPTGVTLINLSNSNPILDALCGVGHIWVFITAYNPRSMPLPLTTNITRQLSLIRDVVELRRSYYFGSGRNVEGTWQEASLLIYNITSQRAKSLARKYEQNAILVGGHHTNAYLEVLYR